MLEGGTPLISLREHAEIQKLEQKKQYDRLTTNRQFEVGQLVWLTVQPII